MKEMLNLYLCRFAHIFQLQLLDRHFPHFEFLNLAGGGHRVPVNEFNVFGDFVVGNLVAAEVTDLFFSHVHPFFEDDGGHDLFSVFSVGDAIYLNV